MDHGKEQAQKMNARDTNKRVRLAIVAVARFKRTQNEMHAKNEMYGEKNIYFISLDACM